MSGLTCDVCNKDDYNAGVCCSGLGAVSFSYCTVCLAMGAEPKGILYNMYSEKLCEGGTYYENDSYYSIEPKELIPIKLKNGGEYLTRKEVVELWNKGK